MVKKFKLLLPLMLVFGSGTVCAETTLREVPDIIPQSSVLVATGSTFNPEYFVWLQVDIYIDDGGPVTSVWKVYTLRGQKSIVRVTWGESFQEEFTVWPENDLE